MTKYSGDAITKEQAALSTSEYLFQVSNKVVLDAASTRHKKGRYINDGMHANRSVNCRFGAARTTTVDKETGEQYISIFATKDIGASEGKPVELLTDYGGKCYWPKEPIAGALPVPARLIRRHRTPTKAMLKRERTASKPPR